MTPAAPKGAWIANSGSGHYARSGTMAEVAKALLKMLHTKLLPLIEADGGSLYVVSVAEDEVRLHLSANCSGCPGAEFTTSGVIEPAVHAIAPEATVHVTTGWLIPEGAERVEAPEAKEK